MAPSPARIVCLTEEPTEILYLLGAQDRIVGISAYTVRPPEAKRDKPVVSAFVSGSVEKIKALEPDLVIGYSDVQADLAAKLIRENLQVLILQQHTLAEILETILLVGRLVGRGKEARELVAGYRRRLDAAAARTAAQAARPRVYFEEWPEPLLCGGGWVSELVELAGGRDVFADRAPNRKAMERAVTSEEVIARAPEVLLASWCGKPFDPDVPPAREGWGTVPAIREGRVHEIDSSIVLQPGPGALAAGLDALEAILRA